MSSRFALVLTACVLGWGSAAMAQPAPAGNAAPANTVAPVTIEAAPKPKVVEKQSQGFVQARAAAQNPEVNQIGRWYEPVCVGVMGLPQADQAAMIKARIESVAKAVGVHPAHAGCKVNVEIVFSDQPQQVMDWVAVHREYLLGYYHRHDHDRLKIVTHPIQAWYVTATRGGGGDVGQLAFTPIGKHMQLLADVTDDPANPPPATCGSSPHFTACLTSMFRNVFMVADAKVLQGKDLGTTADYMAMLALSQQRSLDRCSALPSVTDLYAMPACAGRDPPDGLTAADAAYLTALYAADLQPKKAAEQAEITRRMAGILINAHAGKH